MRLATVTVAPDGGRRRSDGSLVEASVLVRLLGVRLLTLDATIVVVPANPAGPPPAPPDSRARTLTRPVALPPVRSDAAGPSLADAVRTINEGAELLAEARRSGI